jgi:hypothetical protein
MALNDQGGDVRIFISSTFEDLKEHRAAAIRVLRQLGHEVIAMEDLVALSSAPLAKILEMVDRSDAYVGIFAWRYGFIPLASPEATALLPDGLPAVGTTSITHYEYLRAEQRKLPIMAFLLDEQCAWPPQLIDGFDPNNPHAAKDATAIRELRQQLQLERVVARFTTPTELEARVSAAVASAGLSRQLNFLQVAAALPAGTGIASDSSEKDGIREAIIAAGDMSRALRIDLASTWWSTRLYLIAILAARLISVERILIVDTRCATSTAAMGSTTATPLPERFVGQLSLEEILDVIEDKIPALKDGKFRSKCNVRSEDFGDINSEITELLNLWKAEFQNNDERPEKVDLTPEVLRRWFGEAMLQQAVHITDLGRASVVDLIRVLDYPNDYVPVLTRHDSKGTSGAGVDRVDVIDKSMLNQRLARGYLAELMERERIS